MFDRAAELDKKRRQRRRHATVKADEDGDDMDNRVICRTLGRQGLGDSSVACDMWSPGLDGQRLSRSCDITGLALEEAELGEHLAVNGEDGDDQYFDLDDEVTDEVMDWCPVHVSPF